MAHKHLTNDEAFEALVHYFVDRWKVRWIYGKFNVDPRRFYDVLDGETHLEARQRFLTHLDACDPSLANAVRKMGKRWRRSGKASSGPDDGQLMLIG